MAMFHRPMVTMGRQRRFFPLKNTRYLGKYVMRPRFTCAAKPKRQRFFLEVDVGIVVCSIMKMRERPWASFNKIIFCSSQTGFSAPVLEGIFIKYCGPGTPIRGRRDLFSLLKFAKTYPTVRVHASRLGGAQLGYGYDSTKINQQFEYLASVVNELAEPLRRRHESHNRIPRLFSRNVIGSVDTFPLRVQRRKGYMRQRVLYAGKYKCHVLKFQAVVDNSGNYLWFSGLTSVVRPMETYGKDAGRPS